MLYPWVIRRAVLALACMLGFVLVPPRPAHAAQAVHQAIAAAIVAEARALLGAPYAYIGDGPNTGFSCIGFVHYLYARVGIDVPYNLDLAYAADPPVATRDLQPGDLVFFSNTVWRGLSHVALYAGNDQIIGADTFTTGVELTHLSDPYWLAHYSGATRPLATINGVTSVTTTPVPAPSPVPPLRLRVRTGELLSGHAPGAVYSGPGYSYQQIDRLAPRAGLRVVQVQQDWANVAYTVPGASLYGWVDPAYLTTCTVAPSPRRRSAQSAPPLTPPRSAIVIVPVLLLRAGPSPHYSILRRMRRGERVAIMMRQRGWDRIQDRGLSGWAFARWLAPTG